MQEILKHVKPTAKEKKEGMAIVNKIIKNIKIPHTKIIIGGSFAKETWLRNNHDIDIYIKFHQKKYEGCDIAEILKEKLPKATILHGSRDYFQWKEKEYTIEIIPIMDIKRVEDAKNITDISPFHTRWVRKYKKYRNDILLSKAFAKANNFYGAESYIKGFSGYALEVLTIHYKGFKNLMKNVARWKKRTIIDTERHHKKNLVLNQAKLLSPVILIDPVQASRNVTAVVSEEKYRLFKRKAQEYCKNPKKQWFIKEELTKGQIQKKSFLVLEVIPEEGKRDVVGAKLLKCFEFIKDQFEEHDFKLKEAQWQWKEGENALFYFKFKEQELPATILHNGPPLKEKERLKQFQEKWKEYQLHKDNNHTWVLLPRKFKQPKELIEQLIETEFIQKRIKGISHEATIKLIKKQSLS